MNVNRFVMTRNAGNQVIRVKARKTNLIHQSCKTYRGAKFIKDGEDGLVYRFTYRTRYNGVRLARVILRVVVNRASTNKARYVYFSGVHAYHRVLTIGILCRVKTYRAGRIVIAFRLSKGLQRTFAPGVFLYRIMLLCRNTRYAVRGGSTLARRAAGFARVVFWARTPCHIYRLFPSIVHTCRVTSCL